jgi:hypothetical protein
MNVSWCIIAVNGDLLWRPHPVPAGEQAQRLTMEFLLRLRMQMLLAKAREKLSPQNLTNALLRQTQPAWVVFI